MNKKEEDDLIFKVSLVNDRAGIKDCAFINCLLIYTLTYLFVRALDKEVRTRVILTFGDGFCLRLVK